MRKRTVIFLALVAAAVAVLAAALFFALRGRSGGTRLVVHVFYSSTEEALAAVEPALAAARRAYPRRVEIVRHDIEQEGEYDRRLAFERAAGVREGSGGAAVLEAFIEEIPGEDGAGTGWVEEGSPVPLLGEKEVGSLDLAVRRMLEPRVPRKPLAEDERLQRVKKHFGPQALLAPAPGDAEGAEREWREVYRLSGGQRERLGWACFIRGRIDCPLCDDVHFLLALDARGRIRAVTPIHPILHAPDIEAVDKFAAQFTGKGRDSELALGVTLDGITGATKSAKLYIREIRQALAEARNGE